MLTSVLERLALTVKEKYAEPVRSVLIWIIPVLDVQYQSCFSSARSMGIQPIDKIKLSLYWMGIWCIGGTWLFVWYSWCLQDIFCAGCFIEGVIWLFILVISEVFGADCKSINELLFIFISLSILFWGQHLKILL